MASLVKQRPRSPSAIEPSADRRRARRGVALVGAAVLTLSTFLAACGSSAGNLSATPRAEPSAVAQPTPDGARRANATTDARSSSGESGAPSDDAAGGAPQIASADLGGLPPPDVAQSPEQTCSALSATFPEDRRRPASGIDMSIFLVAALRDRMHAADLAMRALRETSSVEVAHCVAQAALDDLVGRGGRYASSTTFSPGALPADRPNLVDPGLALSAYDTTTDDGVKRALSDGILGDPDAWRQSPSQGWDEIDAAVAGGRASVSALNGRLARIVGWALLAQRATDVATANQIGASAATDSAAALQSVQGAYDSLCSQTEDAFCDVVS